MQWWYSQVWYEAFWPLLRHLNSYFYPKSFDKPILCSLLSNRQTMSRGNMFWSEATHLVLSCRWTAGGSCRARRSTGRSRARSSPRSLLQSWSSYLAGSASSSHIAEEQDKVKTYFIKNSRLLILAQQCAACCLQAHHYIAHSGHSVHHHLYLKINVTHSTVFHPNTRWWSQCLGACLPLNKPGCVAVGAALQLSSCLCRSDAAELFWCLFCLFFLAQHSPAQSASYRRYNSYFPCFSL